jgi:hypothetical protein
VIAPITDAVGMSIVEDHGSVLAHDPEAPQLEVTAPAHAPPVVTQASPVVHRMPSLHDEPAGRVTSGTESVASSHAA